MFNENDDMPAMTINGVNDESVTLLPFLTDKHTLIEIRVRDVLVHLDVNAAVLLHLTLDAALESAIAYDASRGFLPDMKVPTAADFSVRDRAEL